MKVKVAETAGFCFGVKRAVDKVYELIGTEQKPIYTLGPIIHNEGVVADLEARGVHVITEADLDSPDDTLQNGTVVIRSHGVGKPIYDKLKEKNISYVDVTCPFVLKIHRIVEKKALRMRLLWKTSAGSLLSPHTYHRDIPKLAREWKCSGGGGGPPGEVRGFRGSSQQERRYEDRRGPQPERSGRDGSLSSGPGEAGFPGFPASVLYGGNIIRPLLCLTRGGDRRPSSERKPSLPKPMPPILDHYARNDPVEYPTTP